MIQTSRRNLFRLLGATALSPRLSLAAPYAKQDPVVCKNAPKVGDTWSSDSPGSALRGYNYKVTRAEYNGSSYLIRVDFTQADADPFRGYIKYEGNFRGSGTITGAVTVGGQAIEHTISQNRDFPDTAGPLNVVKSDMKRAHLLEDFLAQMNQSPSTSGRKVLVSRSPCP